MGKFTSKDQSYFQSSIFSSVLSFVQKHKQGVQLKEKNNQLMLTIGNINSVEKAIEKLENVLA